MSSNETQSASLTSSESFLAKNFELIIYISVGIIALLFVIIIIIIIYLIWRSKQQKKKKKAAAAAVATNEKMKKKRESGSKASAVVGAVEESQEKPSKKKQKLSKINESESAQPSSSQAPIAPAAAGGGDPCPSDCAKDKEQEDEETTAKDYEEEPHFQETIAENIDQKRKLSKSKKKYKQPAAATTVTKKPTTTKTNENDDGLEGKDTCPIWKYFEKEWERMKAEDPVDSTQKTFSIVTPTTTIDEGTTGENEGKGKNEKDKMVAIFKEMKMIYGTPVQQKPDEDEILLLKAPISEAITKAETLSKTAEITAALQNCIINSSSGLLVVSNDGRKWLNSATTQPYIRLWAFTNEYKYFFTFIENGNNEKETMMKEKFEKMSIPVLYCYILNQSIPKLIKIMAMEIMRAKLKCMINSTSKESIKFPHPIPTMFKICAENPSILDNPEWNKFIDSKNENETK